VGDSENTTCLSVVESAVMEIVTIRSVEAGSGTCSGRPTQAGFAPTFTRRWRLEQR
jgi:hypothetical protein